MVQKFIVRGQGVSREKIQRAKELRHNMTEAEKALWQHLRANRLDGWHFRRQQIIFGYIVDFYCHALSLIVEVDGEIHEKQIEEDRQRDEALTMRGFRVIRFKNKDVLERLTFVLDEIRKTCRALEKSPELT
ncbi:MAG: DUF559 domain-containing protein [Anaerolineales bacterium]|nr:DUF559 domain-containing protein [Anaerolineales bacterium]